MRHQELESIKMSLQEMSTTPVQPPCQVMHSSGPDQLDPIGLVTKTVHDFLHLDRRDTHVCLKQYAKGSMLFAEAGHGSSQLLEPLRWDHKVYMTALLLGLLSLLLHLRCPCMPLVLQDSC